MVSRTVKRAVSAQPGLISGPSRYLQWLLQHSSTEVTVNSQKRLAAPYRLCRIFNVSSPFALKSTERPREADIMRAGSEGK